MIKVNYKVEWRDDATVAVPALELYLKYTDKWNMEKCLPMVVANLLSYYGAPWPKGDADAARPAVMVVSKGYGNPDVKYGMCPAMLETISREELLKKVALQMGYELEEAEEDEWDED